MFWDQADSYIQRLYPGLVERCKRAADLPVTLSPFFILDRDKVYGDFRFNEPEEYARYWAALMHEGLKDRDNLNLPASFNDHIFTLCPYLIVQQELEHHFIFGLFRRPNPRRPINAAQWKPLIPAQSVTLTANE